MDLRTRSPHVWPDSISLESFAESIRGEDHEWHWDDVQLLRSSGPKTIEFFTNPKQMSLALGRSLDLAHHHEVYLTTYSFNFTTFQRHIPQK
jgi:hypothetical protein